ncbi:unnamed protein product [Lampetra fluviatilis]
MQGKRRVRQGKEELGKARTGGRAAKRKAGQRRGQDSTREEKDKGRAGMGRVVLTCRGDGADQSIEEPSPDAHRSV